LHPLDKRAMLRLDDIVAFRNLAGELGASTSA
jgi:hypothetical protein